MVILYTLTRGALIIVKIAGIENEKYKYIGMFHFENIRNEVFFYLSYAV